MKQRPASRIIEAAIWRKRYASVCKEYFSRWKPWRLRYAPSEPGGGRCFPDTKLILLRVLPTRINMDVLLIHEICHAVTNGSHKQLWMSRMRDAANTARLRNRIALADALGDEVAGYATAQPFNAVEVYGRIEDFMFENPDATFNQVADAVAHWNGLYRSELLLKFKRCRKVYDSAVRVLSHTKVPAGLDRG